MKCYVLYNPLAGNGNAEQAVEKLSSFCEGAFEKLDITKIESYPALFSTLDETDKVIVCGGDGTLNRFINDTEGVDFACDILYYALGSGNDFLRDVELAETDAPFSIKEYIRNLPTTEVKGKTYRFLNNVGFGIDGYCCEEGDRQKQKSTKAVNYTAIAILGVLFHYKPCNATVTVDGVEHHYKKVWLAPTMKGRYYGGGMMPTPKQDRNDPEGSLSVMVFHNCGRFGILSTFPSIFKGEHVKKEKFVTVLSGKNVHVRFDRPSPVQVDGETISGVTEYTACASVAVKV